MTTDSLIDILAFGPHPDDVEMCCGGLLISLAERGYSVGVVDLSEGELSSNGTVSSRREEAAAAAEIMGLKFRENLGLPDGHICADVKPNSQLDSGLLDSPQTLRVVEVIRRRRPQIVLLPWKHDRHPDHEATSELVRRAVFFANVRKYGAELGLERFRPRQILYYQLRQRFQPSFITDISHVKDKKMAAIKCYKSQFLPGKNGVSTILNSSKALDMIDLRDRYYGAMLGVSHGEPFFSPNALSINDPVKHFRQNNGDLIPEFFE